MGIDNTDITAVSVESVSICVSVIHTMFKQHIKGLAVFLVILAVIAIAFLVTNNSIAQFAPLK